MFQKLLVVTIMFGVSSCSSVPETENNQVQAAHPIDVKNSGNTIFCIGCTYEGK